MAISADREKRIQLRAYLLWLEEGRPDGHDKDHWEQAELNIDREDELMKEDERGAGPSLGSEAGSPTGSRDSRVLT